MDEDLQLRFPQPHEKHIADKLGDIGIGEVRPRGPSDEQLLALIEEHGLEPKPMASGNGYRIQGTDVCVSIGWMLDHGLGGK